MLSQIRLHSQRALSLGQFARSFASKAPMKASGPSPSSSSPAAPAASKAAKDVKPKKKEEAVVAAVESPGEIVGAPRRLTGLHGVYAMALYNAATQSNAVVAVEKDLNRILEIEASQAGFGAFLRDPTIQRVEKGKAIRDLLSAENLSPVTLNFLSVLAENGRLTETNKIISTFNEYLGELRGEVRATITTAEVLPAATLEKVKKSLRSLVLPTQKLFVETKIDSTIIGGVIVNVGDRYLDLSVSGAVKRIENVLKQTVA